MRIVISGPEHYLSQRDNRKFPLSSCNTTSAIMFLNIGGVTYDWDRVKYPQAEDALTAITESAEAYEVMRRDYPWTWDGRKYLYAPRLVHGMLDWAMERLVGRPVARFSLNVPVEGLALQMIRRRPAIVSGRFTPEGHIVVLVGVDSGQELAGASARDEVIVSEIRGWWVNDPFGNWHTGYREKIGDRVYFTHPDFMRLTKEFNSDLKWAHLLSEAPTVRVGGVRAVGSGSEGMAWPRRRGQVRKEIADG